MARKQDHLEAGKRRLEEFRKQKAAARLKKEASAAQPVVADSASNDRQLPNGKIHPLDSEGAGASGRIGDPNRRNSIVAANDVENLHSENSQSIVESQTNNYGAPPVPEIQSSFFLDPPPSGQEQEEREVTVANVSGSVYPISTEYGQRKDGKIGDYGLISREGRPWNTTLFDQSNDYGHFGAKESLSDEIHRSDEIPKAGDSYAYGVNALSSEKFGSPLPHNDSETIRRTSSSSHYPSEFGQSAPENSDYSKHLSSEWRERKAVYDKLPNLHSFAIEDSHATSKGFNYVDATSTDQVMSQPAIHETYPRRSRPSFLDSLNIPRATSTSGLSQSQPQSVPFNAAESISHGHFGQNGNLESYLDNAKSQTNYTANQIQEQNIHVNHVERNADPPQKPSEDFAALEQHIEDLTQEKFSLQRSLEASKSLAESLAAENSSLTESYNQQGGIVAQLKSEMESLQAEISSLMAEHESMRMQYMNAQLECNAADDRAKLLASEVIGLEEKALRLRSNELKLEKELQKSSSELASCKKKIQSLEKERQDLRMTIDALQEEKKLLQSKLRKASASAGFHDNPQHQSKKNVSTSTDDLEVHGSNAQSQTAMTDEGDASASSSLDADNLQMLQQNGAFGFDGAAMVIPSDQLQMIQNINALLSELSTEKEELTRALVAEVSTSSKLKDLNKELSQRLNAQTQRLELLTAQSMARENVAVKQPADSQIVQENMTYADEGDEAELQKVASSASLEPGVSLATTSLSFRTGVVERVLGWIMKLFPGGPSRRRPSKLL